MNLISPLPSRWNINIMYDSPIHFCCLQDRITSLDDLVNSDFEFLWLIPKQIDIGDINITHLPNDLQACKECVENMKEFKQSYITTEMKKMCKERGIKFNVFMKCLRLCFTGLKVWHTDSIWHFHLIINRYPSFKMKNQNLNNLFLFCWFITSSLAFTYIGF